MKMKMKLKDSLQYPWIALLEVHVYFDNKVKDIV